VRFHFNIAYLARVAERQTRCGQTEFIEPPPELDLSVAATCRKCMYKILFGCYHGWRDHGGIFPSQHPRLSLSPFQRGGWRTGARDLDTARSWCEVFSPMEAS
jgi:hypothetical protein